MFAVFFRKCSRMNRSLRTLVPILVLALTNCAPTIQGEMDVTTGSLTYEESAFPAPSVTVALPLVQLVGPLGATDCGLAGPHQRGAPWRGALDEDRTTTISLPSAYARRNTLPTIRYQCRVVSAAFPNGHIVVRDVDYIELPLEPAARESRFAAQRERRRAGCAVRPEVMREFGLSCDIEQLQYIPERSIQPLIVHIGELDERAPGRWANLRARVAEQCRAVPHGPLCSDLENGTWEVMEAVDLGRMSGSH
ncbi:hypothetical protein DSM104635_02344 [Terricaulis silvestris]|uniref:Lipoprotein n=1 Tax=Terricaulis silvestris TaxID=2686094 RepID=A0A6I6MJN2_9CAUL|nr:hypothetical protein DSM104635_02344 [Terricaulis silvestris]